MSMTNGLATLILNAYYVNTPLWVGLHSADPTVSGNTATEISGGSYTRQSITFGAPSNRATVNNNQLVWMNLPGGSLTFLALWTAQSGGSIFHTIAITPSITTATGGTFIIPVSDVAISLT